MSDESYIDGSGELGGEREVRVVEGDYELALLVEGVLEVDTRRLGSGWTLDGALKKIRRLISNT